MIYAKGLDLNKSMFVTCEFSDNWFVVINYEEIRQFYADNGIENFYDTSLYEVMRYVNSDGGQCKSIDQAVALAYMIENIARIDLNK